MSVCLSQGVLVSSFVLLVELFPTPYQLQASLCLIAFGMASTVLLPLLMWIIKSWRYVQLAVSAPGVVFLAHVWYASLHPFPSCLPMLDARLCSGCCRSRHSG